MPKVIRQRPRDATGVQRRTLGLDDDPRGQWSGDRPLHPASVNSALEAGMRPFLSELTIPQRDALRLVYWEGLSEREAAEKLGIQRPALQDRLRGAKEKLRKALTEAAETENYADVRQWLTPLAKITRSGVEDKWTTTACVECGEYLAQYRANALGFLPHLNCGKH